MLKKNLYNFYHRFKLKDWVDPKRLDYYTLASNENALFLLENNLDKINWQEFCKNMNDYVIEILKKNKEKINYQSLSSNPCARQLLLENFEKICWMTIVANENATDIILDNFDNFKKYDFLYGYIKSNKIIDYLKDNNLFEQNFSGYGSWYRNPFFFDLIKDNVDNNRKLFDLVDNHHPGAIKILEERLENFIIVNGIDEIKVIDYLKSRKDFQDSLSQNPSAMPILMKHPELIDWIRLSSNPSAIDLLKDNQEKIEYTWLSKNPAIFELDYDFLHERMNIIRHELMKKTWHPDRFREWCLNEEELIELC